MWTDAERAVALWRLWQAWRALVADQCGVIDKAPSIRRRTFLRLRANLLALSCELAEITRGADRKFYDSLAELVQPWLSLEDVAQSPEDVRAKLWECCQEIDRCWPGPKPLPEKPPRASKWMWAHIFAAVAPAALAAFLPLLAPAMHRVILPIWDNLPPPLSDVKDWVRGLGPWESLGLVAVVMVTGSAVLLMFPGRPSKRHAAPRQRND
jgi:hypothetical protein